jgi:hypothetical protein
MDDFTTIAVAYTLGVLIGFSAGVSLLYIFLKITGKLKPDLIQNDQHDDDVGGKNGRW